MVVEALRPRLQTWAPARSRIAECRALKGLTGGKEIRPDEDGDFAVNYGTTQVWIHVSSNEPVIQIRSAILWGVDVTAGLLEELNTLNGDDLFVRLWTQNGGVACQADLLADRFLPEQFEHAVRTLAERADTLGPPLKARFGGRTFGDSVESSDAATNATPLN